VSQNKTTKAASSDLVATGDEDGRDVLQGDIIDGSVESARRAAALIIDRGYGPATTEIIRYIAGAAVDTADLNAVIIEQMNARLLEAESAQDVLDPFGTIKGQDVLEKYLLVTGCAFMESDQAEGFPWYVSLSVEDKATGRTYAVTVGGEKVVMQAAAIDRKGMWPAAVKIHKSERPTKSGFYPLELQSVI
jgi:hypothetical protein